jgi:hypothetical protein
MRLNGEWRVCDDGIVRPAVLGQVVGADGKSRCECFLIDTLADRTVFSAGFLAQLHLPTEGPSLGLALEGVGGRSGYVLLRTVIELSRDDGGVMRIEAEYAAFTDPSSSDLSILGRDVLNVFDVIVSRRRNEVVLLHGEHAYHIAGP